MQTFYCIVAGRDAGDSRLAATRRLLPLVQLVVAVMKEAVIYVTRR